MVGVSRTRGKHSSAPWERTSSEPGKPRVSRTPWPLPSEADWGRNPNHASTCAHGTTGDVDSRRHFVGTAHRLALTSCTAVRGVPNAVTSALQRPTTSRSSQWPACSSRPAAGGTLGGHSRSFSRYLPFPDLKRSARKTLPPRAPGSSGPCGDTAKRHSTTIRHLHLGADRRRPGIVVAPDPSSRRPRRLSAPRGAVRRSPVPAAPHDTRSGQAGGLRLPESRPLRQ